jgi:hypothetical protein
MLTDGAKILHQGEARGSLGRGVAIATAVENFGSTPRPAGSRPGARSFPRISFECAPADVYLQGVKLAGPRAPKDIFQPTKPR